MRGLLPLLLLLGCVRPAATAPSGNPPEPVAVQRPPEAPAAGEVAPTAREEAASEDPSDRRPTLEVLVVDPEEFPLPGAEVELLPPCVAADAPTEDRRKATDERGWARFDRGLCPGIPDRKLADWQRTCSCPLRIHHGADEGDLEIPHHGSWIRARVVWDDAAGQVRMNTWGSPLRYRVGARGVGVPAGDPGP